MSESHRVKAFGKTKSGYLWCLHCERVYKEDQYRTVIEGGEEYQMCPYEDCNGNPVMDGWDWEDFREKNSNLPESPELGKSYPLYPK